MAPLGVVATSRQVSDFFDDHMFAHGHTYEAHPLTLAPAIAAIDEYRRLDLLNRSRQQGEKLGARLRELKAKHVSVGDVRGLGLFWAIDLVKDRTTKQPFNTAEDKAARKPMVIDEVTADLMKRGVFCMGWMSHLVLAPPLIIDDAGIDEAVLALDAALAIADSRV
jgi:taurine--2-oxoglutarate transaminase